jgi:hypothetical protein
MVISGGRNIGVEGGSDDFPSSMTYRTCVVIEALLRIGRMKTNSGPQVG